MVSLSCWCLVGRSYRRVRHVDLSGFGCNRVGYSGWGDSLGFLLEPIANSASVCRRCCCGGGGGGASGRLCGCQAPRLACGVCVNVGFVAVALPGLVVALAIAFWALQAPEWMLWLLSIVPAADPRLRPPLRRLGNDSHKICRGQRSSQIRGGRQNAWCVEGSTIRHN